LRVGRNRVCENSVCKKFAKKKRRRSGISCPTVKSELYVQWIYTLRLTSRSFWVNTINPIANSASKTCSGAGSSGTEVVDQDSLVVKVVILVPPNVSVKSEFDGANSPAKPAVPLARLNVPSAKEQSPEQEAVFEAPVRCKE